jgi:hypothetical protein
MPTQYVIGSGASSSTLALLPGLADMNLNVHFFGTTPDAHPG